MQLRLPVIEVMHIEPSTFELYRNSVVNTRRLYYIMSDKFLQNCEHKIWSISLGLGCNFGQMHILAWVY
jgi:hypothetical protein